ncbi:Transmembrane protease serine 9 [Bulinus truncatus]|nr:Transmembrane protease serine 9 [Bulinus truncatus]
MALNILVIFCFLFSLSASQSDICGQANSVHRIIGGTNATTCEFPWMALLHDEVKETMCGGAIIDSTHILTAAHCVVSENNITNAKVITAASNMLVYTGSSTVGYLSGSKAVRRSVTKVTPHEKYDPSTDDYDLAILTQSKPINYTNCQRPICLVNATSSPQNARNCKVMGWGITSNGDDSSAPANLLWVDVPVANDTVCRSQYGPLLTANNFCAGSLGKDSSEGDSGGPLACRESDGRYYVQGVVSFGLEEACGLSLGIYTKVSRFIPWIQSIQSNVSTNG